MLQSSLAGGYLQQVTDSWLTITFLSPIAVAIARSVGSYLTIITRLLYDSCVLIPENVIDQNLCIESIVYEIT